MNFAKILAASAAVSLVVIPAMAAPVSSNPAAALSVAPVAKKVRAGKVTKKKSGLSALGTGLLIAAGVGGTVGGIIAATQTQPSVPVS